MSLAAHAFLFDVDVIPERVSFLFKIIIAIFCLLERATKIVHIFPIKFLWNSMNRKITSISFLYFLEYFCVGPWNLLFSNLIAKKAIFENSSEFQWAEEVRFTTSCKRKYGSAQQRCFELITFVGLSKNS